MITTAVPGISSPLSRVLASHAPASPSLSYEANESTADEASPTSKQEVKVSSAASGDPNAMIFWLEGDKTILPSGAKGMTFENKEGSSQAPLALSLFKIEGVEKVTLSQHNTAVSKASSIDWCFVKPKVESVLSSFFAIPGLQPVYKSALQFESEAEEAEKAKLMERIGEVLDDRIRPVLQDDGGDVDLADFDEKTGVLSVRLKGACAGCPMSSVTLRFRIENMLVQSVPEVKK
ncbi:NFU1 iron-sulfur cluster scaffold, partial [Perkinsus olseni]